MRLHPTSCGLRARVLVHGAVLFAIFCRHALAASFHPAAAGGVSRTVGLRRLARRSSRIGPSLTRLSSTPSSAASVEPTSAEGQPSTKKLARRPWYSDPSLGRDKSRVVKAARSSGGAGQVAATSDAARFALFRGREAYHISFSSTGSGTSSAEPLFLTYGELAEALGDELARAAVAEEASAGTALAWVGDRDGLDYWTLRLPAGEGVDENEDAVSDRLTDVLRRRSPSSPSSPGDDDSSSSVVAGRAPLREVGDGLESASDAAILATANGLLEFHASHGHCSRCGSPTASANSGRSRRCTNSDCRAAVYPRIDAASIMLVTSPCGEYALLGRKASWPRGRYSTLAGFAEVGETLEECCVRETFEESGVRVDPASVVFVASQPWPFPRSLMVGFRARAEGAIGEETNGSREADEALPEIRFCEDEMEDVRWFHRDYVASRLRVCEGSTALSYKPTEEEAEFHVPGKASLARLLISEWANEN